MLNFKWRSSWVILGALCWQLGCLRTVEPLAAGDPSQVGRGGEDWLLVPDECPLNVTQLGEGRTLRIHNESDRSVLSFSVVCLESETEPDDSAAERCVRSVAGLARELGVSLPENRIPLIKPNAIAFESSYIYREFQATRCRSGHPLMLDSIVYLDGTAWTAGISGTDAESRPRDRRTRARDLTNSGL